jgi:hypothetical protein
LSDIFVIYIFSSETRLLPNSSLKLNNYHIFRSDRPGGYGGSAITIRNGFQFRIIFLPPSLSAILLLYDINLLGVALFDIHLGPYHYGRFSPGPIFQI